MWHGIGQPFTRVVGPWRQTFNGLLIFSTHGEGQQPVSAVKAWRIAALCAGPARRSIPGFPLAAPETCP